MDLRRSLSTGLCFTALSLAPGPSAAEESAFYDVGDLVQVCEASMDKRPLFVGLCLGMFQGLSAAMMGNCVLKQSGVEIPGSIVAGEVPSTGAAVQSFMTWANSNPQLWDLPASKGAAFSLSEAFACADGR